MPSELLFVYGTLMRGSDRALARRLSQQARFVGEASMQGRLYSLGSYPGAVASDNQAERVEGEVFDIAGAPPGLIQQLDRYEGCAAGQPEPHPYARVKAQVRLSGNGEVAAWTYLYTLPVAHLIPLAGGRWLGSRRSR